MVRSKPAICTACLRVPIASIAGAAYLAVTAGVGLAQSGGANTRPLPNVSSEPVERIVSGLLPRDRQTFWQPGLMAVGGIPERKTTCATVRPLGNDRDDTMQIQKAVDACPVGQIVQLSAGTFLINSGNFILLNKGITLRGEGPLLTSLTKTNGARTPPSLAIGAYPSPLIIVGPARYVNAPDASGVVSSTNLSRDAAQEDFVVEVEDARGLEPGQVVLLDELSGAGWQPDAEYGGQVWASDDGRVVWRKHKPAVQFVDDFAENDFPSKPETAGGWFSRLDRPTSEVKQIRSVSGKTVTFTSPIHISYRHRQAAQISRYASPHVEAAGVEDLKISGGDADNIQFRWAASSWARNIECTMWAGACVAIRSSFRVELRDFYIHDSAWVHPGGGSYGMSISSGSAEVLVENGIAVRSNKAMVFLSSGAGSVVGYNYVDMTYISSNGAWIETGINASHMVGSHHVLFEGNYAHNADSDNTHGNSIYHTFFRNYLRGVRAPFDNQVGGRIDDENQSANGPKRAAGLMGQSYWMSFIGNVLGVEGKMTGWVQETWFGNRAPGVWMLGWGQKTDPKVAATVIRHGNYDYLSKATGWDTSIASRALPPSFYLREKPFFFKKGRGYEWPWVDPTGPVKTHALPAKVRYDSGAPFIQP